MRRWLARLSFSFFIIAFFLGWEAYKAAHARPAVSGAQIGLYAVGAMLSAVLGFAGVRERHREQD